MLPSILGGDMLKLITTICNIDKHQFQLKYNQVAVVFLPLVIAIITKVKLTNSSYSIVNYLIIDIVSMILLLALIQLLLIVVTKFKYNNQQLIFKSLSIALILITVIIIYRILSLTDVRTTLLAANQLSLALNQINKVLTVNVCELVIVIVTICLSPKYIANKLEINYL